MQKILYLFLAFILIVILFFSFHLNVKQEASNKINFSYKDGLFYEKNTDELYTGRVVDTADVIITFEVANGRKNGIFTSYFLEGGIEKEGMIINDNNEGTWKYYYFNGQIETIGDFNNNLPDGKWITYHINGEVKTIGYYQEGIQNGCWSYFDENGKLINSILFINGILMEKVLNAT